MGIRTIVQHEVPPQGAKDGFSAQETLAQKDGG